jgi:hypothetical protein
MDQSQMRIRPGFLWFLLGCLLISLVLPSLLPEPSFRKNAKVAVTRVEASQIESALRHLAVGSGGLTNIDNSLVVRAVLGTNGRYRDYHAERTNPQGELLDWWKTPYQIEIKERTNFVVRSAGPNRKLGDTDDIVFNSISNNFAKP